MACWLWEGEWWFAWRPVRTMDGRWVWWDWVWRSRTTDIGERAPGWEYGHGNCRPEKGP